MRTLSLHLAARKVERPDENSIPSFLFLQVLRCFTSLGASHAPMYSAHSDWAFPQSGFPIRTSPGQRLLATSPKLIAGCYVLHQHVLSSHPPYTLSVLSTHCQCDGPKTRHLQCSQFEDCRLTRMSLHFYSIVKDQSERSKRVGRPALTAENLQTKTAASAEFIKRP